MLTDCCCGVDGWWLRSRRARVKNLCIDRTPSSLWYSTTAAEHLGWKAAVRGVSPAETSTKWTILHFFVHQFSTLPPFLLRCFRTQTSSHSPMGVATRLVASTPTQADAIRWGGVTSIDTGAAAISSDRHSNRIRPGPTKACLLGSQAAGFYPREAQRGCNF